jgi:hypothetical protein
MSRRTREPADSSDADRQPRLLRATRARRGEQQDTESEEEAWPENKAAGSGSSSSSTDSSGSARRPPPPDFDAAKAAAESGSGLPGGSAAGGAAAPSSAALKFPVISSSSVSPTTTDISAAPRGRPRVSRVAAQAATESRSAIVPAARPTFRSAADSELHGGDEVGGDEVPPPAALSGPPGSAGGAAAGGTGTAAGGTGTAAGGTGTAAGGTAAGGTTAARHHGPYSWSTLETTRLKQALMRRGTSSSSAWYDVAQEVGSKTESQCRTKFYLLCRSFQAGSDKDSSKTAGADAQLDEEGGPGSEATAHKMADGAAAAVPEQQQQQQQQQHNSKRQRDQFEQPSDVTHGFWPRGAPNRGQLFQKWLQEMEEQERQDEGQPQPHLLPQLQPQQPPQQQQQQQQQQQPSQLSPPPPPPLPEQLQLQLPLQIQLPMMLPLQLPLPLPLQQQPLQSQQQQHVDTRPLEDDARLGPNGSTIKRRRIWTADEEARLREELERQDVTGARRDWQTVATHVATMSIAQCVSKVTWEVGAGRMPKRYLPAGGDEDEDHPLTSKEREQDGAKAKEPTLLKDRRVQWTLEEIDALQAAVMRFGTSWVNVAKEIGKEKGACKKKFAYEVRTGRMSVPVKQGPGAAKKSM